MLYIEFKHSSKKNFPLTCYVKVISLKFRIFMCISYIRGEKKKQQVFFFHKVC